MVIIFKLEMNIIEEKDIYLYVHQHPHLFQPPISAINFSIADHIIHRISGNLRTIILWSSSIRIKHYIIQKKQTLISFSHQLASSTSALSTSCSITSVGHLNILIKQEKIYYNILNIYVIEVNIYKGLKINNIEHHQQAEERINSLRKRSSLEWSSKKRKSTSRQGMTERSSSFSSS